MSLCYYSETNVTVETREIPYNTQNNTSPSGDFSKLFLDNWEGVNTARCDYKNISATYCRCHHVRCVWRKSALYFIPRGGGGRVILRDIRYFAWITSLTKSMPARLTVAGVAFLRECISKIMRMAEVRGIRSFDTSVSTCGFNHCTPYRM